MKIGPSEGGLGTALVTGSDRQNASLVAGILFSAFVLTLPWATTQLRASPAFVPMYDTAVMVLDILAAVLLYAQFEQRRRPEQLVLVCAYLFTPLVICAHALSIPNAFTTGFLFGGVQSAAWLWVIWHGFFPVMLSAYACLASSDDGSDAHPPGEHARARVASASVSPAAVLTAVVGTILAALGAVSLVASGERWLPSLMRGDAQDSGLSDRIFSAVCLLHMLALAGLVWRTRLRRVIDLWLAVSLVALTIEVLLSAVLINGRYQVGFYLGRAYGLFGTLVVLAVLLRESVKLAALASRSAIEARRANRTKDEFIAMVGHELRNPLAPIMNAMRLMELKAGNALAYERAVVNRQLRRMERMVDDLLDAARMSRGQLELTRAPVDVRQAVADAIESVAPLIEQKQHRLQVALPPEGAWVDGDLGRLTQVVSNLLGNAARYTPAGGSLSIRARMDGGRLELDVADNGAGLSAADQSRVFEAFERGASAVEHSSEGMGLGLAIVRSIVELHGGEVSCQSAGLGAGSTFTVMLPLLAATKGESRYSPT